ncbi:GGDEF domain-containing protein [Gracilimonas tropica]|uniref:GGDEF domain-containing protein n=1 Tax=Gracilimonas tropica TaxID=454600 RepID=UPI000381355D|nr:GGDEF domain-containing protein [Gracilimonas tropica]
MAENYQSDIRDIIRQIIATVLGAGVIAMIAFLWTPFRSILLETVSAPIYLFLIILVVIISTISITYSYRKKSFFRNYEARIKELKAKAATDNLTDLPDPESFHQQLREEYDIAVEKFKNGHSYDLTLIIVDIDNFKEINDNISYDAGDEILTSFASLLKTNLRGANDYVGKYRKGDEFGIILPDTTLIQAREGVAERLRGKVIEPHKFEVRNNGEPIPWSLTMSAGLTNLKPKESLDSFINRAEEALRSAKKSGKNTVRRLP